MRERGSTEADRAAAMPDGVEVDNRGKLEWKLE
jgi:hypothetical protein